MSLERDTKILLLICMWLWILIVAMTVQYYNNEHVLSYNDNLLSSMVYGLILSSGIVYALKEKIIIEVEHA